MYCEACGANNPATARFCLGCGARLPERCPHCGADLPGDARFCPACGQLASGSPPLEHGQAEPAAAEERKQVTVLFADFSGFTAFSAQLDAEDVRDQMISVWSRLDAVIKAHGGKVEKHIGDALMAVFGAGQAREDDPDQAVRAGLEMQSCLAQARRDGCAPPLDMRIGVHTGSVVLGPLGGTGEFAATGDTVNLANHLEQCAPVGAVLISHDTYRHVYGSFDAQSLPPQAIKGRADPVQTYVVLRARPRSLSRTLRGVEGVESPMIGRQSELGRLQSVFQSVMEERELHVLTIVGDPGIGKTRLLLEFQKWVELLPQPARLLYGRATAEMAGLPFSLLRDIFASRFEIQESDSPTVAREKLEKGVINLLGSSADASATTAQDNLMHAHFIGQLLGLDFSASPHLRDLLHDTEQVRNRAFHYLRQFFVAISQGPASAGSTAEVKAALLLVEDIHSSDDGSLDLIAHLARTCQGVPLMILCLARPSLFDRRPAWGEGLPAHTLLNLEPLSRRDSRVMVESLLKKALEIPQALRDLVVEGAEGNPFYIEELIKMLIDRKVIVPSPEQWRIELARLADAEVPPTLTGVLQARLDELTPHERAVLDRASVVGRVFWDSAIEQLSHPDEKPPASGPSAQTTLTRSEIVEALAGLRHKLLILRRESSAFAGTTEYTFKHELLRNVAYESVLKKLRRVHHGRVAAWLIGQSGERVTEFAGLVATHFEHAGMKAEAAEWYGRAGQQARQCYAPATAIEYFHKASSLLPAQSMDQHELQLKRLEWNEGLGEALGVQARFAEGLEAYADMRLLADALGDRVAQARACNGVAYLLERRAENRASVESAERAEVLAREAGDAGLRERIKALYLKGWALYRLGEAPAVLGLAEQTLKLYTDCGDRRGMANSFKLYGVAHLHLGQFDEADSYFKRGLALCQELGDRRNAGAMWSNLGESARLRGDYEGAAKLYQNALAIVRHIGHRDSESIYLNNLSGALLGLHQFERAENILRKIISQTPAPNGCTLSETYRFLSEACLGQQKMPDALDAARQALALAQKSENGLDLGGAWRAVGRVAAKLSALGHHSPKDAELSTPPIPEPTDCFRESLRVFKELNAEAEQARTLRVWAKFELEQGRHLEALQKTKVAQGIFIRLGMPLAAESKDTWI